MHSGSALLPQAILVILASCQAHQPVIPAEAERSEAKWPESVAVFAIFESKVSLKMDVGLPFSSSISAQIPATAGFSRKSFGRNDGWSRKQRGATVHCALATCTARSSSCDLLLATANLFATCHLRLATAYLPATPSTTRPARKSSGSAKAGASSCTPVGRPSTRPPLGRASAGRPARLAETVKRSAA